MRWLVAAIVLALCIAAACVREVDLTPTLPDAREADAVFGLDSLPVDAMTIDAGPDAF